MGDRTRRTRLQNEPDPSAPAGVPELDPSVAETLRRTEPDVVQRAIDNWADKGDALPGKTQMDRSNIGIQMSREDDAAQGTTSRALAEFEDLFNRGVTRGRGYLQRRRVVDGRTALVPPNCERHPRLGDWGFNHCGKWMIIRWVGAYPRYRQKRFEQGYQYFEGEEWCRRLGLDPSVHLKETGRIWFSDVELAWIPDVVLLENRALAEAARQDMVSTAQENLMAHEGRYVQNIRVMEGTDEEVLGELAGRRRHAEARS